MKLYPDLEKKIFEFEELYYLGKRNVDQEAKVTRSALKLFQSRTNSLMQPRKHNLKPMLQIAAMVAVLLGGVIASWATYQHVIEKPSILLSAGDVDVLERRLPDGSKVWLKKGSTLRYESDFNQTNREVTLSGEAYFDVSQDRSKPFVVQSKAVHVEVLGTSFNMDCKEHSSVAEVVLERGSIRVEGNNNEGLVTLEPGQKATVNRKTRQMSVRNVDSALETVWRKPFIPFTQSNLFTIAQVLESCYDVKIILSPSVDANITYSGVIKRKENIEGVLHSLKNTIPINYKVVGTSIFISSKSNQ